MLLSCCKSESDEWSSDLLVVVGVVSQSLMNGAMAY